MTFLRTLSTAFGRLADSMQGQDVERARTVGTSRYNSDYASIVRVHSSQGISPLGMGR